MPNKSSKESFKKAGEVWAALHTLPRAAYPPMAFVLWGMGNWSCDGNSKTRNMAAWAGPGPARTLYTSGQAVSIELWAFTFNCDTFHTGHQKQEPLWAHHILPLLSQPAVLRYSLSDRVNPWAGPSLWACDTCTHRGPHMLSLPGSMFILNCLTFEQQVLHFYSAWAYKFCNWSCPWDSWIIAEEHFWKGGLKKVIQSHYSR